MTKLYVALAAGAVVLGASGQALAQDFQPKTAGTVMLNVRVTDISPEKNDPIFTLGGAPTGLQAKVDYDVMPTIGLSYFFTDNLAVEIIAGTTQHTVKAVGLGTNVKVKETWVLPPTATLQYHIAPSSKISPYVGAGVNYMFFYGGSDKNGFSLRIKDGFGLAIQAGADIALSGPWSLNLDAKKI